MKTPERCRDRKAAFRQSEGKDKNSKKAVLIAVVVGFIVGFMFSLSLPYLAHAVADWQLRLPDSSFMSPVVDNLMVIAWGVIGATSVFAALNTYEVSIALLTKKGSE
ncbi:hypothetical protein [Duncaniella dubosii]|uniref:hypothetical protein n=1 Tax=Duncaniella dubosii TaxID=2518971 RepID=UPI003F666937